MIHTPDVVPVQVPLDQPARGLWVPKGWGGEHVIVNDQEHGYCGKRMFFLAGLRFSYHYHDDKHETFYVLCGTGLLYFQPAAGAAGRLAAARTRPYKPGDVLTIPPRTPHQIQAETDTQLIEFSMFDAAHDSYRLQKGD
jgi:quercetin dioxygenase-like cupin family protein